jgi:hypothetical protein
MWCGKYQNISVCDWVKVPGKGCKKFTSMNRIYLSLVIAVISTGCGSSPDATRKTTVQKKDTIAIKDDKDSSAYTFDTIINLGGGLVEGYEMEYNNKALAIRHNGRQVFADSTRPDYELGNPLNPGFIQFGDDIFEVFLEENNSPNKSTLKMLKFQHDQLIETQVLPTFFAKPHCLFGPPGGYPFNTNMYYAAFSFYTEQCADSNGRRVTDVTPILYYKLTNHGMILDSAVTLKKNKEIWGGINVFTYDYNIPIPVAKTKLCEKEVDRIINFKDPLTND